MKWKKNQSGDRKTVKKFAFMPITINKEVRWLEWVNIQYRFYEGEIYYNHINRVHYRRYGWIKEKFIEVE